MSLSQVGQDFWTRRLHSAAGLFLVIFIIFHLLTNSQAALWVGDDGNGFIRSVNSIHEIPYLQVVEVLFLGFPILVHAFFGIRYLHTGLSNSFYRDGRRPYLPEYGRNHAYTWQRITSWILLIGILAHVLHMRFIDQPVEVQLNGTTYFSIPLERDEGLQSVAKRLNVNIVENENKQSSTVVALAHDFGTAELLLVRETFKSPLMMLLYTIFVLAACFHAFNGLWTFMISWGVTLSVQSQKIMLWISTAFMALVTFFGLVTIYITYWVNLRQ